MTAAEARKKQWESLRDKPLTDKLKYIFTYYWPGIVGALCVVIFLVSWIGNILLQKDVVLGGHIINGVKVESYAGDLCQDFMALQGFDSDKETMSLGSNYLLSSNAPTETIMVMESLVSRMAAGEIDFIISDLSSYTKFSAYHTDLRDVLTIAQQAQWKDRFVYVEQAEMDKLLSDDIDEFQTPEYFLSAEGLEDPLPIGIRLPDGCRLLQAYDFSAEDVIFGIPISAQHIDTALAFLEYITG